MKRAACILAFLLGSFAGFSQSKMGLEQYQYMGSKQLFTYMPIAYLQTKQNWYAEARYNYEDMQTFSLFLGKAFEWERAVSGSCTPLLGGSLGRFEGLSTGMNLELEYGKFFCSTQSQYSFATDGINSNFLYYWSEFAYQGTKWLYAGYSMQQTDRLVEHGMVVGLSFKRVTVPVYAFTPFAKDRYFIVGVNLTWD